MSNIQLQRVYDNNDWNTAVNLYKTEENNNFNGLKTRLSAAGVDRGWSPSFIPMLFNLQIKYITSSFSIFTLAI